MLSVLHSLNSKLFSKQYIKIVLLNLIVVPQLSSDWQHNNSTKTRQKDCANEQYMNYLMAMVEYLPRPRKVKGFSPTTLAGTRREKNGKRKVKLNS
jgi:hypothetical protein